MYYFKYYVSNGYIDCDETDVIELENYDDINNFIEEASRENAEGYEYIETGWDCDFETEEDREAYYENALSYAEWEEITKEEYEEYLEDKKEWFIDE